MLGRGCFHDGLRQPLRNLFVTGVATVAQALLHLSQGLLLFIDEADAFLGRRGGGMSEGMRGALNAILFRTGDQSRDFSVVLATNRPGVRGAS